MFENRSFDNIFGYLYNSETPVPEGQKFEGLAFGEYWNESPAREKIDAHIYRTDYETAIKSPDPDPGEEYQHVNTQLFDTIIPFENRDLPVSKMEKPYNVPGDGEISRINMKGFVKDYFYNVKHLTGNEEFALKKCQEIMGSFHPDMLPVLSTLARGFAVYDHWFSAVPSQTFCNRAFFHASTSSGYVTNLDSPGIHKWYEENPAKTIFDRLHDQGIPWVIYYDHTQPTSITKLINEQSLKYYPSDNFRSMTDFYNDVADGTLPAYAFIEPRQIFNHNDMHPPMTENIFGEKVDSHYDMRAGEMLLHDVYSAIRKSASTDGSNAMNTTLLVTFDEHGGTYDHVVPPAVEAPKFDKPTECGFKFDRLGVRVPAIAISAYTRAGTVINDEMHHGSMIATLCRKYGLDPLKERDESARDIRNAFNLSEPRPPEKWPDTKPRALPFEPQWGPFTGEYALTPLTPPGRSMLALLIRKYGEPGDKIPRNYGEAYETLERLRGHMSE